VAAVVAIALIASLNGSVLGSARVAFAMARGGAFWAGAGKLHPKTSVPTRALWLGAAWACVLVMSNGFEQILGLVSVAMVVSGSLTVSALFVLRYKRPELNRPWLAWGYPWLPLLYLAANAVVVVVMLVQGFSSEPGAVYPLFGLILLVVAYFSHRLRTGFSLR
jgi:APA family basic amino acid/polyamine antiporter